MMINVDECDNLRSDLKNNKTEKLFYEVKFSFFFFTQQIQHCMCHVSALVPALKMESYDNHTIIRT